MFGPLVPALELPGVETVRSWRWAASAGWPMGVRWVLRLAGPADVPAITGLYRELSPESFYGRFHGGQMAPSLLARFASLGGGTVCLVAAPPADPGRLAAEAATYAWDQGRRNWR